jgi:hypothetical protein
MSTARSDSGSRLWAVTAYFNPAGYQRRLANYRVFMRHLNVPLVTVEQGIDGRFDLDAGDADVLLRVQGGDVLWQKERLINVGLGALPERCEAVAWLDCDVVFDDAGWGRAALEALEQDPLVQLFRTLHHLPRDASLEGTGARPPSPAKVSLACAMRSGCLPTEIFRTQGASMRLGYSPGHAWAARRSLLSARGLYDAFIMGSGDKVMASAAFGHADAVLPAYGLNDRQAKHYLEWAVPFYESVSGRVGFADQTISHLWHGDLSRRRYGDRYRDFARFDFDPFKDISLTASGCWSWSSDKPELHQHVRQYFAERGEDGVP